jgi:uncharacterized membrane protein YciS (DUF1049 family)
MFYFLGVVNLLRATMGVLGLFIGVILHGRLFIRVRVRVR